MQIKPSVTYTVYFIAPGRDNQVAVWHSGNDICRINKAAVCWAHLLLGWVLGNHLSM